LASYLIVVYGPPLAGKTTLAWELARSLPGKTAVLSTDHLLAGSIATSDTDALAELDMAHTQLRLLTANYLKNRYNLVVEGPFYFERDGVLHSFEPEIDQLVALMRHLTEKALVLRLDAPESVLTRRAHAAGREDELASALRLRAAYRDRSGDQFRAFDTGEIAPAEIVAASRELLLATGVS